MNIKPFFATLALTAAISAPAFAQDVKTKSDSEKTKTKADGMMNKTKVADDGKMKLKGKSDAGDKMKAKTKPRKGDMTNSADAATSDGMNNSSGTTSGGMSTSGMNDATMGTSTSGGVMVGGAMMTPNKDIVDNAAGSADHTTLVSAVKAAGLVETLKGAGPFTVFAPSNSAFDKLPAGTVNSLVTPEMKPTLTKVLTYHVVPGRLTAANLTSGQVLTTVQGEQLTVVKNGNDVMIRDAKGGTARVTIADVVSSNGVTHVVDTVLMPAK
ncbi:Uncaracterized surface protein containing fasciclin (FAS1) repeats [Hymenobacter arizonensis]|uniref:Uncaracterized surface protein containing fasciclin (FAS1) repeats n=2 Tax=Hymenobacter arizonensis TaxID=1227077 RepID=A0A1I5ZBV6_HYMAR|nr:Uncaracterized surface protein containing fasciclin (FAS1) repeats [Hymenobacter arizonensis]